MGGLGRKISLGIGFGELREKLGDWEGDRRIMQNARGSRQEGISKNIPTISEDGGDGE